MDIPIIRISGGLELVFWYIELNKKKIYASTMLLVTEPLQVPTNLTGTWAS